MLGVVVGETPDWAPRSWGGPFAAAAIVLAAALGACGGDETSSGSGGPVRLCDRGIYEGGQLKTTGDAAVDACLTEADAVSTAAVERAESLGDACGGLAKALGASDTWSAESSPADVAVAACNAAAGAVARARGEGALSCDVEACEDGATVEARATGTSDDGDLEAAVGQFGPAIYLACTCAGSLVPGQACSGVTSGTTEQGDDASSCLEAAGQLIVDSLALGGYLSSACNAITAKLGCRA